MNSKKKGFIEDNWEKITAITLGVIFICIILGIALFNDSPSEFQIWVFRVVLGISAAGFTATVPGILHVNINNVVKAGGAFGVLVLVYLFNPPALINAATIEEKVEIKGTVIDGEDKTHLKNVVVEYTLDGNNAKSKTDSNGVYILNLDPRIYRGTGVLKVTAAFYEQSVTNIDLISTTKGDSEPIELKRIVETEKVTNSNSPFALNFSSSLSIKSDIFSNPGSPQIWFQEAKMYDRTDKDYGGLDDEDAFKLERTYNSFAKNRDIGFGYGWDHQFASRININKSTLGEIVFFNKKGRKVTFKPAINYTQYSNLLLKKNSSLTLETQLQDAFEAERDSTESFFLSNIDGLVYYGMEMNLAELTFEHEYLVIKLPDNDRYIFDRKGRLKEIVSGNLPRIELRYDPVEPEKLVIVTTKNGREYIRFFYSGAHVSRVELYDGSSYEYEYNAEGGLLNVKDIEGNKKSYKYDSFNRLSFVSLPDKEPLNIKYNDVGWKKELLRGDVSKSWTFSDSESYSTVNTLYVNAYGYESKKEFVFNNDDYSLFVKSENGQSKQYTLSACGCMPLEVTSGGEVVNYEYNAEGNLVKLSNNKNTTEISYDKAFNKISSVKKSHAADGQIISFVQFSYDPKGNLSKASSNDGKSVALIYNNEGKIITMGVEDNEEKEVLEFEYNSIGKPVKIVMLDTGSINVEYDEFGEISKIESETGHKMALQVTQAFQSLLSIVKLAGITIDTDFNSISSTI